MEALSGKQIEVIQDILDRHMLKALNEIKDLHVVESMQAILLLLTDRATFETSTIKDDKEIGRVLEAVIATRDCAPLTVKWSN